MNGGPAGSRVDLTLTIVSLTVTFSATILFTINFVPIVSSALSSLDVRPSFEPVAFVAMVLLLIYGVLVYQIARLGYAIRVQRWRGPEPETLRLFGYGGAAPEVTFLVPSYKEQPGVVEQALFSVALQDYPHKRIVLLIDDPPFSQEPEDRDNLAATRRLGERIQSMVAAQREQAHNAYLSFLERGRIGSPDETCLLCEVYRNAATWLASLAARYPQADHTNRLFVRKVLREPAEMLQRDAQRMATRDVPAVEVELRYRQLVGMLSFDILTFERKRYENLSHEPNKAMNLNSYLGLMGGTYKEEEREGKISWIPSEDGFPIPETDYVATLDADSLLAHDYTVRLVHFMEQPENRRIAVIQTPYSAVPEAPGVLERIAGATTDVQFVIHQGFTCFGATYWVGANAICRKRALDDIATETMERGIPVLRYIQDRTVIEDTESSIDLIRKGWTLYNYPKRLSYSATPPDFGSLVIQRRRWANGGLIILPKLISYLWRNMGKTGWLFLSGFLRIHYLASPAFVNLSVLVLLLYPFSDALLNPWMFAAAFSYYFLYARDLVLSGHKATDVFRVYAMNLLLIPVQLGGALRSIGQAISGRRIPFARTPKVQGRTSASPLYICTEWLLAAGCCAALAADFLQHRYPHIVFTGTNAFFFLYALWMIGLRNCLADLFPRRAHSRPAANKFLKIDERFFGHRTVTRKERMGARANLMVPSSLHEPRRSSFRESSGTQGTRRRYSMPYRLLKGIYAVRCRHPQCPFNDQIKVEHFISGVTEEDVRSEAMKVARDQATVKHNSIFGRRNHGLESPEVRMVSGQIRKIGRSAPVEVGGKDGIVVRRFRKGEVILRKGDAAGTVCEVLEGSAYPRTNRVHRYIAGDCFGVAALVPNHTRMSDVIASVDDTVVAFYDLVDLRQREPGRATRIVAQIMEDTLQVVDELGKAVGRMHKGKHKLAS